MSRIPVRYIRRRSPSGRPVVFSGDPDVHVPCDSFRLYFWDMDSSSLSFNMLYEYLFLFVGMTLLYLVGVCDDLVGVGYRYKFAVQIVSALLLVLSGNWFGSLGACSVYTRFPLGWESPSRSLS